MTLNPTLLGELKKLDPELWAEIYEIGFRTCYWPNHLVMGKVLEALDRMEIPVQFSARKTFSPFSGPGPYFAYGYANDVTRSDYMEEGNSWTEAVLKLYLQILRRIK